MRVKRKRSELLSLHPLLWHRFDSIGILCDLCADYGWDRYQTSDEEGSGGEEESEEEPSEAESEEYVEEGEEEPEEKEKGKGNGKDKAKAKEKGTS